MLKRATIWWKLKQVNRIYHPLLEKAKAEGHFETYHKLEERQWYETACLLAERRKLHPSGKGNIGRQLLITHLQQTGRLGTQVMPKPAKPSCWVVALSILAGIMIGAAITWYVTSQDISPLATHQFSF